MFHSDSVIHCIHILLLLPVFIGIILVFRRWHYLVTCWWWCGDDLLEHSITVLFYRWWCWLFCAMQYDALFPPRRLLTLRVSCYVVLMSAEATWWWPTVHSLLMIHFWHFVLIPAVIVTVPVDTGTWYSIVDYSAYGDVFIVIHCDAIHSDVRAESTIVDVQLGIAVYWWCDDVRYCFFHYWHSHRWDLFWYFVFSTWCCILHYHFCIHWSSFHSTYSISLLTDTVFCSVTIVTCLCYSDIVLETVVFDLFIPLWLLL